MNTYIISASKMNIEVKAKNKEDAKRKAMMKDIGHIENINEYEEYHRKLKRKRP